MRQRVGMVLLLDALLSMGLAGAAAAGPQEEATPETMKEFKFVVGAWKAVPATGKTPKYDEEMTYAAILDGRWVMSQQFLRDKESKIVYRDCAVYGIDPDTHRLFFHAYNTDGSMDRSHQVGASVGRWVFEGAVYGSDRFRDYRYTMTKVDEDHIHIVVELKKDGRYEKWSDTQYVRKSRESKAEVQ
jgi:hypothetical protein